MKVRGYFAALAVPVLAGAGVLAATGSAYAATTPTISATNATVDAFSNITASYATTAGASGTLSATATSVPAPGTTLTFTETGGIGSTFTWTGATGTMSTATLALSATTPSSVKVTVQDAKAEAVDIVTVTPGSSGDVNVSVTPDIVGLNAPNNTTNADDATFTATGGSGTVSYKLGSNQPAGVGFSAGVLSAETAVAGRYPNQTVTASDSNGATAVETFTAVVKDVVVPPVRTPIPRLSDGHAVVIAPTREDVYFVQSGKATWDHFTIVGPGAINGHQGWVNAQLGLNAAVYSGLDSHQGYTVYYQPVEGQGSTVPVPGSHWGYVYFVS